MIKQILLLIIYYGSYAFAWFLFLVFLRKLLRGRLLWIVFRWAILALFVRARFVEPNRVQMQDTVVDVWFYNNFVLIWDLHLWPYKKVNYLKKIIDRINTLENIDAVLIAWDFVYEPKNDQKYLDSLFAPLAQSKFPVIAVLGNHDVEVPGPDIRRELTQALNTHGVTLLHNDRMMLWNTTITGIWPHMAGEDQTEILDTCEPEDNIVVLTHNPDTVTKYRNENADVTLVWHTHCGQIRLPWIQEYIRPYTYPVEWDFDCGLIDNEYTKLYITSWLGEVMLPMRFMNPPMIDVIHLR